MGSVKIIVKDFENLESKVAIGCSCFSKIPFCVALSQGSCCMSSGKQGPFKDISHAVTLAFENKGTFCGQMTVARYFIDASGFYKGEYLLFERSDMLSWMEFIYERLEIPMKYQSVQKIDGKKCCEFTKTIKAIDAFLSNMTFLVGESLSHADVYLAIAMDHFIKNGKVDASFVENDLKHMSRLLRTVHANDEFAKYMTIIQELKSRGGFDGVVDVTKSDVFQVAASSDFSLDVFKKLYSNCKGDLRTEVIPTLFKTFDDSCFTFYFVKYNKLEDECKSELVTSNMLSGFLQRFANEFRKMAFGVMNVMGKDQDFNIMGVLIIQGTALPECVITHPSYEFHSFTKLNHKDPMDQKIIADYFCESDFIDTVPIASCVVFK
ncbi:bifunctional Elongation factor 1B gamma [Babesia duncani]|uniref:Bifunctional Elongation factor 1B gamma n=1 Tax=Babesia duncani TaxID=323732 RepID=A0AAD9PPC4_9APIC|nr:bifunctional Elongation factor 1B gamma [Babesia duncani]